MNFTSTLEAGRFGEIHAHIRLVRLCRLGYDVPCGEGVTASLVNLARDTRIALHDIDHYT
jgi:hypothetical protein